MLRIAVYWMGVLVTLAHGQVRLSEVMFRPDTLASYTEFVEIVNLGDQPIDLNGWALGDSLDVDALLFPYGESVLSPGQFAVILDPGYFDHAHIYDALIPDSALVLTIEDASFGRYGLRNAPPLTIFLYNAGGMLVDSVRYTSDNPPGYSDEKIDLHGPNTPQNWANSRRFRGTPGAPNSVSPLTIDVQLLNLVWQDSLLWDNVPSAVGFQITNTGRQSVAEVDLVLEIANSASVSRRVQSAIFPGDTVLLMLRGINLPGGWVTVRGKVQLINDADTSNNGLEQLIYVETADAHVVFNEIMFEPRSGEAEWVEITNIGQQSVSLHRVVLSDFRDTITVQAANAILQPGDYWVLVSDSSLKNFPDIFIDRIIVVPGFPTLNNDVDEISLRSPGGRLYDRVRYSDEWYGRKIVRGTSLEKINPRLPAQQKSSWAAAVAPNGSTPTQPNSVFIETVPTAAYLTIAPNPFSPDGDGVDDYTLISLNLPSATGYLTCRIFDVRGRLVRTLATNQPIGSQVHLVWNGRHDRGQIVPIGMYIVLVDVFLTASGKTQQFKGIVVLAKQK